MDIGFTEEQDMLRAAARRFLDSECPTTFVRACMATREATTDAFWQKLAEQGWLGISTPRNGAAAGSVSSSSSC